jgi:outer membrane protein TolC
MSLAMATILVAGCASTLPDRGTGQVDEALEARGAEVPAWPSGSTEPEQVRTRVASLLQEPLTAGAAVELAFLRSPRIHETYADLGIAQADVLEASRVANPRIGYIDLEPDDGGRSQITRSVSLNFGSLLLQPARSRLARDDFSRAQQRIGADLLSLEAEVRSAWYTYVGAQQVAELRQATATVAENSAEFAQRLCDAGNITPRELALELASSSAARIGAARAQAEAVRARAEFAQLAGLSTRDAWQVSKRLPAPLTQQDPPQIVADQAFERRLDVAAARTEVHVLESAVKLTRRWRWLGDFEAGYERETETDGTTLKGPTFAIELPIFNQNQGGVLRAEAQLEAARARLAALELGVRNELALSLDRMATTREIAEAYRTALVPQREAVVERTQEEVNFMLAGTFELLQAKREEFNAYEEYLDAVRDYWLARTELRRVAGGDLPGDVADSGDTIGIDEVIAPTPKHSGHAQHDPDGGSR